MSRRTLGLAIAVAVFVGITVTGAGATSITTPTGNPYLWPGDAAGDPQYVTVTAGGYTNGDTVKIVQCDGTPSSSPGWNPNDHCDNLTSPASVIAPANGVVTFDAANVNTRFKAFKGDPGSSKYNCYSPGQIASIFPGGFTQGQTDPSNGIPSWSSCQVMVSTDIINVTSNQVFLTISLPDPDSTPPTGVSITAPTSKTRLASSWAVSWTATDPAGIDHYDVERRILPYNANASAWTSWRPGITTKSTTTTGNVRGNTYCYRVKATDNNGNTSAFSAMKCTAVPLYSDQLAYSSGWTKITVSGAYGGFVKKTTTNGKYATRTGSMAEMLSLVATKCAACGSVKVSWNGTAIKTVSLHSSSTLRKQVIPIVTFSSLRTGGTIKISVTSATGKTLSLEGLAIYRD